jgi:CDP-glucose 4,6-dehydratase
MDLSPLFGGVYAGRRVLVTGHTGFKGSWLAAWLARMGAIVTGVALDPDTTPSHWTELGMEGVDDQRIDLRDAAALDAAIARCQPEFVFHLAAQALVRRSYRDPVGTFAANVTGLVNLLESVRRCESVRVVVNATTDKVYADAASPQAFREDDALGGHDPYSTSKACAELVSDCYRKSFFETQAQGNARIRLATARAGNVIGGGDWAEDRLVPDLVRAARSGSALRIRNPDATRPWQHVLEPLSGYLRLGQQMWAGPVSGGAWNFGPSRDGEVTVGELASRLASHWPALRIEVDAAPHPHEAAVLRLDSGKAIDALQWRPVWGIETTAAQTIDWYRAFYADTALRTQDDLAAYVDSARALDVSWAR